MSKATAIDDLSLLPLDVSYRIGIDCGSKTVKAVILGQDGELLYKSYLRHRTNIHATLRRTVNSMREKVGDVRATFSITGSAGMQIADELGVPFVQEVVASKKAVQTLLPQTDVVIELGGEDSKILFLTGGEELRMNSTCAGGTGGFIDTIAGMLGTNAAGLSRMAAGCDETHPIASRCAVFAGNDVRAMLNEGISKAAIGCSTLQAVVNQCVSGLACGREVAGNVVFLGGPLHYIPPLAERFRKTLDLDEQTGLVPKNAHLFVAIGAALAQTRSEERSLSEFLQLFDKTATTSDSLLEYLDPLFKDEAEYEAFKEAHKQYQMPHKPMWHVHGPLYLGIDSGSTTMKGVLVDTEGNELWSYYRNNDGDVITSAKRLLRDLYQSMILGHTAVSNDAYIAKCAITGYGEGLLKEAFHMDYGLVETVAHLKAAQRIMPDVDFLLDIGGQDIKCIRIRDGIIDDISLNEACSSGCGALLGGFANNMHMTNYAFMLAALDAKKPVDLGMRCTVFMTSRVRHAQKAGASAGDISAGLAYSVVKNALYRVVDIKDPSELGRNILVQGGTFKNDAVLRALEKFLGRQVGRCDAPELMGAYGAALYALEHEDGRHSELLNAYQASTIRVEHESDHCTLCGNACSIMRMAVSHSIDEARQYNPMIFIQKGIHSLGGDESAYRVVSSRFIMGNRCSRPVENTDIEHMGINQIDAQYRRLFRIENNPRRQDAEGVIGIPRALDMYEQFPFWQGFFTDLGYRIVLSKPSSSKIFRKGMSSILSESTCYPAKLAHGHIADLAERDIDFIFYPRIANAKGAMECPVVVDYAHILEAGIDLEKLGIRFVSPRVKEPCMEGTPDVLDCLKLLAALGEPEDVARAEHAAQAGMRAVDAYQRDIAALVDEAMVHSAERGCINTALVCRPYHIDPEINHGIPEMLCSYGLAVVSSDAILAHARLHGETPGALETPGTPAEGGANPGAPGAARSVSAASGWRIPDRHTQAVDWAIERGDFEVISLYSFGCGIDACSLGSLHAQCEASRKVFTSLKIDDMTDITSTRIRVRSLLAALDDRKRKGARRRLVMPGWLPTHSALLGFALAEHGIEICADVEGNGVSTGIAVGNSDMCQVILSAVGQVAEYRDEHPRDTQTEVLLPLICPSCCSQNITSVANGFVDGFAQTGIALDFNEFVCECANAGAEEDARMQGVPSANLLETLAQTLVAGDIIVQASCRLCGGTDESHEAKAATLTDALITKLQRESSTTDMLSAALSVASRVLPNAGASERTIGVVGCAELTLTPSMNNRLFDVIAHEGCEAIPPSMTTQAIHSALVEAEFAEPEKARILHAFADRCRELQKVAAEHLEGIGVATARLVIYDALERCASAAGVDRTVSAGMGWCAQAAMLALLEQGYLNILYAQTFACLSSHVSGSAVFKEIRALHPAANLASVEYDVGISQVNQINRVKLLASLIAEQ